MSIRKRVLPSGQVRWQLDYKDAQNKRRARQFEFQWQAKEFETKVRGELQLGTHVPDSASCTVKEASDQWLDSDECKSLERGTLKNYRTHLDLHILPLIGPMKLSRLSRPAVQIFKNKLLKSGRSPNLTNKVLISLGSLLSVAYDQGLIGNNPVKGGKKKKTDNRHKKRREIPEKDEIRAILAGIESWPENQPWRIIVLCAIFTGLRSSELRGLTWDHVDFDRKVIEVRQRADLDNVMGSPKSEAGNRDVPMAPHVLNTLRRWKLACPKTEAGIVFPTTNGNVIRGCEIRRRWTDLLRALGLPHYRFHDLRHVAASLFIEHGWPPMKIKTVMGHSSIQMTYNTYGHMWKTPEDDQEALAQIEARLLR